MEKFLWNRVIQQRSSVLPPCRWGHSSVLIEDELFFFGGYADSCYMNDVWTFNTNTMVWTEIKTTGCQPSPRSNCSISYDSAHNRVVIFGGGNHNKKRFNTLNILDWTTKQWKQIEPKVDEQAPWQRTYHTAELIFPYLVVFGGESLTDMDDIWVFDLEKQKWKQIKCEGRKPCARRFHSSALIGNTMYVIAGCFAKYRCLNDVWAFDLTSLIQKNQSQGLSWEEIKMQNNSFLTRWGQSSSVLDNKIYVFGGRFSNDLNDILLIDPVQKTVKTVKTAGVGQIPKPRRRHSSNFIGSNLLIFGGFNGQYFNDLHYINLFESKGKNIVPESLKTSNCLKMVNNPFLSDWEVKSLDEKSFCIHKGIMKRRFKEVEDMENFIKDINEKIPSKGLLTMLEVIYSGVGQIDTEILQKYSIQLFESKSEKQLNFRTQVTGVESAQKLSLTKTKRNFNPTIELSQQLYQNFILKSRSNDYKNIHLVVNNEYFIPVNTVQLALTSRYFASLFKNIQKQTQVQIDLPFQTDIRIYEVLINYLTFDYAIVPEGMNAEFWVQLYKLSEYYCLGRLQLICQNQITALITTLNSQDLLQFAIQNELHFLSLQSSYTILMQMLKCEEQENEKQYQFKGKNEKTKLQKERAINWVYQLLRFDLNQVQKRKEYLFETGMKRQGNYGEEKENRQYYQE